METPDGASFAEHVASMNLPQVDQAVALLWFADRHDSGVSMSAKTLGDQLHVLGLSSRVNATRLGQQLRAHTDVVSGMKKGTFKLRLGSRAALGEKYESMVGSRPVRPSDSVIPRAMFASRRDAWRLLVAEVNGCYDAGFYDGAAVLLRRLVECLLVAAFEAKGHGAAIKRENDYAMLREIIGVAMSGQYLRLSKSARPALEPVKRVGDTAAHGQYHITQNNDIDDIAGPMRVLVSELLGIIDGK